MGFAVFGVGGEDIAGRGEIIMNCLGGCYICERLLDEVLPLIMPWDSKVEFCKRLIVIFDDAGCDGLYDAGGKVLAFDEAYGELRPEGEE